MKTKPAPIKKKIKKETPVKEVIIPLEVKVAVHIPSEKERFSMR